MSAKVLLINKPSKVITIWEVREQNMGMVKGEIYLDYPSLTWNFERKVESSRFDGSSRRLEDGPFVSLANRMY